MKIGEIYVEKEVEYFSQKEEIFIFKILSMDNINMRIQYLYPLDINGIENVVFIEHRNARLITNEEKLELL